MDNQKPIQRIKLGLITYETILHRLKDYTKISSKKLKEECFEGLPTKYNFPGRLCDMEKGGDIVMSRVAGKKFYSITAAGKKRLRENKGEVQPTHTNWEKLAPAFTYERIPGSPRASTKNLRAEKPPVEIEYTGAAKAAIEEVSAIIETNDIAKKLLLETYMQFTNYLNKSEDLPDFRPLTGALAEVIKETQEYRKIINSIQLKLAKGIQSDE